MVYSLVAVYILCVVPRLFSLNQIAIPGVLTLFALPYLAACIFFAMTASIAIRNRETCMLLFVFTSVPLLFLSGISWPGAAMPEFWRYFPISSLPLSESTAMYASTVWEPLSTKYRLNIRLYGYKQAFTSSPLAWSIVGKSYKAERKE